MPQDQLEALIPYLEKRIALSEERGNNARQRATRTWLAKWERAVWKELSRRIAEGDLPAPAVRDDLKLSYAEIEKARAEVARDDLFIMNHIVAPAEVAPIVPVPTGLAAVAADIDQAFANVAQAFAPDMPLAILFGQAPQPRTPEQFAAHDAADADLDMFYDRVRQDQARVRHHTKRVIRNVMREHHARARR